MFSAAGVTQYLKFRELKPLEAWECRKARRNGQLLINGRPVEGKIGATVSHTMFLAGDLDDDSNCEVGTVTLRDRKVLGGMASQGLYVGYRPGQQTRASRTVSREPWHGNTTPWSAHRPSSSCTRG